MIIIVFKWSTLTPSRPLLTWRSLRTWRRRRCNNSWTWRQWSSCWQQNISINFIFTTVISINSSCRIIFYGRIRCWYSSCCATTGWFNCCCDGSIMLLLSLVAGTAGSTRFSTWITGFCNLNKKFNIYQVNIFLFFYL